MDITQVWYRGNMLEVIEIYPRRGHSVQQELQELVQFVCWLTIPQAFAPYQ